MRTRAFGLASLLVVALIAESASTASAATLWTTSAHTTRVTVGATASLTGSGFTLTSGTSVIYSCTDVILNSDLRQNNDAGVVFAITNGTFNGCNPFAQTGTFTTPWTLTISGTGTTTGGVTTWPGSIDSVAWDLANGQYTGNLTGVTVTQPASGSPITLRLDSSGTIVGPLTGNGRLDGSFVLTGAAAAYSLTN